MHSLSAFYLFIYLYPPSLGNSPTEKTGWQIFVLDGLNDADACKDVPFLGFVSIAVHLRGQIPTKPQFLGCE